MPDRAVLFLGDSHTKGQLGGSFVTKLQKLVGKQDLQLLAYGINGETTESIGRRVWPILQQHPQPAAVFILPGSNDCLAREHPALQVFYNWAFRLSSPCSLQSSLDNVRDMIDRIRQQAPSAKASTDASLPGH